MKKLNQIGLLLFSILGFISNSQAAVLIEPVAGYTFGKNHFTLVDSVTPANDEDNKDTVTGGSFGGRLGYQNFGFQIGADYLNSNMKVDGDKFKTEEWAGFIGFEFPILLRIYAGYIFSGTGKLDDDKFKGGTGPKVGLGLTLLPFLDFNIEYRKITYAENDDTADQLKNNDYGAVMVGFSLPITL